MIGYIDWCFIYYSLQRVDAGQGPMGLQGSRTLANFEFIYLHLYTASSHKLKIYHIIYSGVLFFLDLQYYSL